jgi:hypothetical protein
MFFASMIDELDDGSEDGSEGLIGELSSAER